MLFWAFQVSEGEARRGADLVPGRSTELPRPSGWRGRPASAADVRSGCTCPPGTPLVVRACTALRRDVVAPAQLSSVFAHPCVEDP